MSQRDQPKKDDKPKEEDSVDLHEPVDWMTYTHQQLYDMVTKGVDLGSAHTVKDGWTELSTVLADVQQKLRDAILKSDQGWEGESAEKAREGLLSVTEWAGHTSEHAQNVATCIDTEIKNVDTARNAMPPPPAPLKPPVPVPDPVPVTPTPLVRPGMNRFATLREDMMISESAQMAGFNSFADAKLVAAPAVDTIVASDASHRAAADVMAAFQRNSIAVDATVPQLAPPTNPVAPAPPPVITSTPNPTTDPGTGGGVVPPATGSGSQGTTRTSSRGGGGMGFGRGSSGGGGNFSRTFVPPAAAGAGGGGAGPMSSGGGASGVLSDSGRSAGAAGAAAAAAGQGGQTKAFQNPMQMGAAPMAAAPAARSEDEREYKHASYLEEDDNLFGLDRKAAPPVIGQ